MNKINMKYMEKNAADPLDASFARPAKVQWDEQNLKETKRQVLVDMTNESNAQTETSRPQEVKAETQTEDGSSPVMKVEGEDKKIVTPRQNDILLGRGAGVNLHAGNAHFRVVIQANKQNYVKADPGEKKRIISRLVKETQSYGRFLKQNPKTENWELVKFDDVKKKIGQALRENATAIKQEFKIKNEQKQIKVDSHVPPALISSQKPSAYETSPRNNQPQLPLIYGMMDLRMRMRRVEEKQNEIKRKQRDLEDEQSQLLKYYYQITSQVKIPTAVLSSSFNDNTYDSSEDSECSYERSTKRRKNVTAGH